MKKLVCSGFFMFLCAAVPVTGAVAVEKNTKGNLAEQGFFAEEDKGFSYELAGDAEEEGALKLFVKNTASDHEIYDISADDLNRINPAAGIKLQFEF